MNTTLRAVARKMQEYCETTTCEACPFYQENHPSGIVCGLNAPRLKREFDDWTETQAKYVGRPKGSKNRVNRRRKENLHIGMTKEEKDLIMTQARESGLSVADLVRDMADTIKRKRARKGN